MGSESSYYEKEYGQLIGKKVVGLAADAADATFMGLRFDDGTVAWIQCDPEGNGPGFLQIDVPKQKKVVPKK